MATLPARPDGRHCRDCGVWKPFTEFHVKDKQTARRDSRCTACHRDYCRAHRDARLEEAQAKDRARHEQRRDWRQRWREANREHLRRYDQRTSAAYYRANGERLRAYQRDYREAHLEQVRARAKRWRQANPDIRAATEHRRQARKRLNGGSYTAQQWRAVKAAQDYR